MKLEGWMADLNFKGFMRNHTNIKYSYTTSHLVQRNTHPVSDHTYCIIFSQHRGSRGTVLFVKFIWSSVYGDESGFHLIDWKDRGDCDWG